VNDDVTALPGFDGLMGLRLVSSTKDRTVATLEVTADHHQPFGLLHGGVLATIVETVGSISGSTWYGGAVVGTSNHTNFLRAVRSGVLTATSTPVHRGRTQQLWEIEIRDDRDRLVAKGQLRLANLDSAEGLGRD
jgi:1,4-dihydroxy-2-naphthoyl-CoA hydrolase